MVEIDTFGSRGEWHRHELVLCGRHLKGGEYQLSLINFSFLKPDEGWIPRIVYARTGVLPKGLGVRFQVLWVTEVDGKGVRAKDEKEKFGTQVEKVAALLYSEASV